MKGTIYRIYKQPLITKEDEDEEEEEEEEKEREGGSVQSEEARQVYRSLHTAKEKERERERERDRVHERMEQNVRACAHLQCIYVPARLSLTLLYTLLLYSAPREIY